MRQKAALAGGSHTPRFIRNFPGHGPFAPRLPSGRTPPCQPRSRRGGDVRGRPAFPGRAWGGGERAGAGCAARSRQGAPERGRCAGVAPALRAAARPGEPRPGGSPQPAATPAERPQPQEPCGGSGISTARDGGTARDGSTAPDGGTARDGGTAVPAPLRSSPRGVTAAPVEAVRAGARGRLREAPLLPGAPLAKRLPLKVGESRSRPARTGPRVSRSPARSGGS